MKKIVISGSRSGIGKTLLAEEVLRVFPDWSALKITVKHASKCPRGNGCDVCSEFKEPYDVVTESGIINKKGTDTARLKKAGAKKVAWLRTGLEGLKEGLEKAFLELKGAEGLVIEGTSVLKYVKPDIAIYLRSKSASIKKSAELAERKADIIIDVSR